MEFDKLISNGQLTKAARLFAKEYYDSGRMGNTRRLLIERLADKCDKYDAEIARKSVATEEVPNNMQDSVQKAIVILTEWCEKVGKYAQFDFATYTEVDGDKECEYEVKVNYCPNCGRKIKEEQP